MNNIAFEKRIRKFLRDSTKSSASQLIRKIEKVMKKRSNTYEGMFDEIAHELGFSFYPSLLIDNKKRNYYYPNY